MYNEGTVLYSDLIVVMALGAMMRKTNIYFTSVPKGMEKAIS